MVDAVVDVDAFIRDGFGKGEQAAEGFRALTQDQSTPAPLLQWCTLHEGLSEFLAKLIAACNGTEYFLASWIPVFTIEKIGRSKLMLFGAAGMSISMIVLAVTDSIGSSRSGIAETVFLFLFNTCFASK